MGGPKDEMLDRQVGRYRIVRHLASGGMAELYIARQEAMGGFEKEIVVKILQPRYAENPRVVQMFLDEARLAAKLNHQSIVHVYDVAEDGGMKYIAMEYIRGETLTEIVKHGLAAGKYLPLEHAVHVARQAAAGLAYAHTWREPDGHLMRIVHRDVSPTNILVTTEGQTKIVDFGIARAQDELREESGIRPGKASYMSPEQVRGEGVDTRSDIFSLGVILYELALGQRLFRGPAEVVMKRIAAEKVAPPTAVRRDFPPALELIIMRALEKRPEDRYQSAEDMRVDLEEFLADEGLRTGSRRVALYMKEIFPREGEPAPAPAPAAGVDQGAVPLDVRVRDDSEELNFDRRAPLSLRFEAAAEDEPGGSSYPAPIPAEDAPDAPRTVPAPPPPARATPVGGVTTFASTQAFAAGNKKKNGVAGAARVDSRAAPAVVAAARVEAPPARNEAVAAAGSPAPNRRGWLFLLFLLLGAAALAFVGTR
ncbi:MAG TPA: serine/threonine-protein kinase [Polyangia bacterium]|nr:serine/threonine-protein kinase [Polyangia bacterium]